VLVATGVAAHEAQIPCVGLPVVSACDRDAREGLDLALRACLPDGLHETPEVLGRVRVLAAGEPTLERDACAREALVVPGVVGLVVGSPLGP
jgi:hypothetical protein